MPRRLHVCRGTACLRRPRRLRRRRLGRSLPPLLSGTDDKPEHRTDTVPNRSANTGANGRSKRRADVTAVAAADVGANRDTERPAVKCAVHLNPIGDSYGATDHRASLSATNSRPGHLCAVPSPNGLPYSRTQRGSYGPTEQLWPDCATNSRPGHLCAVPSPNGLPYSRTQRGSYGPTEQLWPDCAPVAVAVHDFADHDVPDRIAEQRTHLRCTEQSAQPAPVPITLIIGADNPADRGAFNGGADVRAKPAAVAVPDPDAIGSSLRIACDVSADCSTHSRTHIKCAHGLADHGPDGKPKQLAVGPTNCQHRE